MSTPVSAGLVLGASPNAVAAYPGDADRPAMLYLANAGENSVVVLDQKTLAVLGRIPTAQYPTAVAALPGGRVLVACAKGLGADAPADPAAVKSDVERWQPEQLLHGTLEVIQIPPGADLAEESKAVLANLERPRGYEATPTCPAGEPARFPLPVPTGDGNPSEPGPIQHVVLLVRENKTYDAILGDLDGANGDPRYTLFGEDVTPNAHALARAFTNLDNFYSHAEASIQGHQWTTGCIANDYTEKAWLATWGRGYRPLTPFSPGPLERLAAPGSDSIFVHLDKAGVAYHIYGELAGTAYAATSLDPFFPGIGYNLDIPDGEKVDYVLERMGGDGFELEPFTYLLLPGDHTFGTRPGKPTPQSMVAENDEAVGRFVEALSRSRFWASSLVILVEDDPRDSGDHVERHRTVGLLISPWVKRGYVSHVNYDLPAAYRTVERILGLSPMNAFDANAPAIYDAFTTTPDFTPYTYVPRKVAPATNAVDAPLAEESSRIDFGEPDGAPLDRILWKAVHGRDAEPPWAVRTQIEEDDD
jgi:YVTN family beta-propeller protein